MSSNLGFNDNDPFKNSDLADDLDDIKYEDADLCKSPGNSDDERDERAVETARSYSEDSKLTLPMVKTPSNKDGLDPKSLVFGHTASDMTIEKLFTLVALHYKPAHITQNGKKLFNIQFDSPEDCQLFALNKYNFGKVVSLGRHLSYFYRVTYTADGVKEDHEDRIIHAFADAIKIAPVSCTVNPGKKCVSVYVATLKDFAFLLSDPAANDIKVPARGAFAPAFWLHCNKCTATTNDADVQKVQISNIPTFLDEYELLSLVREALAPIISRRRLLGAAVYRYPDSGKPSRFGFAHIKGRESADLLEKVEIPIEGAKEPVYFQKAIEKNVERVDSGEQRGNKRPREV